MSLRPSGPQPLRLPPSGSFETARLMDRLPTFSTRSLKVPSGSSLTPDGSAPDRYSHCDPALRSATHLVPNWWEPSRLLMKKNRTSLLDLGVVLFIVRTK